MQTITNVPNLFHHFSFSQSDYQLHIIANMYEHSKEHCKLYMGFFNLNTSKKIFKTFAMICERSERQC